jgi:hypothetical protein
MKLVSMGIAAAVMVGTFYLAEHPEVVTWEALRVLVQAVFR